MSSVLYTAAFLALLATPFCFGSSILVNGSFESVNYTGNFLLMGTGDTTSIPGWTVTGACGNNCVLSLKSTYTELQATGTLTFNAEEGNQALDLTGSQNSLTGGVRQTVATSVGQNYTLSFWLGNMDSNDPAYALPSSLLLDITGQSQQGFSNANNTSHQVNWLQETVSFTATSSSTTIQFTNNTPLGDNYLGLDNASLVAATPEPASFVLICAGGALLFSRRFSRRISRD